MFDSTTTRSGSRYTDLPRPATPVSSTSRASPYRSSHTRPSEDVLRGGSAFGLASPVWRPSPDAEWRSSRHRINPNPALSAPSTPRSTSLSFSFPHTQSFTAGSKANVDLPPRKGDLFRRAGESNELPPPLPTPRNPSPPPSTNLSTPLRTSSRARPELVRATPSPPPTPSRVPNSHTVPDTPSRRQGATTHDRLPPSPTTQSLSAESLPERARASSSPREATVLAPLSATPHRQRDADNSYHEPAAEEKRKPTSQNRMPVVSTLSSTYSPPTPTPTPSTARRAPIKNERTVSMGQSVSSDARRYLIPPQREHDVGKLVVVLDLDETLVYSREGGIFQRPGVKALLEVLKGRCELVVWTAGVRDYALEAIQLIDTCCAVQHCIYRHPMWFTNDVACPKDLRLLGRPLETIIIVDNTPDVFRHNPENAILVTDFLGKANCNRGQPDRTLTTLAAIFDHVLSHFPSPRASHVLASKRLVRRSIKTDDGVALDLFTLKHDRLEDLQRELLPTPSLAARFAMLRYMNRGSHLNL